MAELKPKKRKKLKVSTYSNGATRKTPIRSKSRVGLIRRVLMCFASVASLAGVLWIGLNVDLQTIYGDIQLKFKKPISNVQILGEFKYVTREQVQGQVLANLDNGFLSQKLIDLKVQISEEPWIESVSVRRRWPNTLEVNVVEHKPIARWGDRGVINIYGELVQVGDNEKLNHLPLLKGPEEYSKEITKTYVDMSQMLVMDKLKVSEISVNSTMGWVVTLDTLFKVELGKENVVGKMKNFLLVYHAGLHKRQNEIEYIDARYDDGIAVKWLKQEDAYLAASEG